MTIDHIHCPVNGYDCPYFSNDNHPDLCLLDNPIKDCEDFGLVWDEDDDFIDDDWEEEEDEED